MIRALFTGLLLAGLTTLVPAQIQNQAQVPPAPALAQGGGAIVPLLQFEAQTVEALGYNLQTGAFGLGYDTGNTVRSLNTLASFQVVFLDSREGQPLVNEVGANPDLWSVHFKMRNFTARLNVGSQPAGLELVRPSWLAEVQGHGFRFGTLTQAGRETPGGSSNNPVIRLTGANEVLNIGTTAVDAGATDFVATTNVSPNSVAFWGSAEKTSGLLYGGYRIPDRLEVYLSALAQGDVNADKNTRGWAFALNGQVQPFGAVGPSQPLAVTLKGDAIQGYGFKNNTTSFADGTSAANLNEGDTAGFGLAGQVDLWAGKDIVISPLAAFDGRLNDPDYSTRAEDFEWEAGAGLMVALGPKKFVKDEWNELSDIAATFANNRIQKFAYFQVVGMTSEATGQDLAVKFEEPDGAAGLDPSLGFMGEYRLNNYQDGAAATWSATGRLSTELFNHTLVPYVRAYANGTGTSTFGPSTKVKLRVGAQLSVLQGFGLEAAYLSPQVYASGTVQQDQGKLELIAILSTAEGRVMTPKTMNFTDWKTP